MLSRSLQSVCVVEPELRLLVGLARQIPIKIEAFIHSPDPNQHRRQVGSNGQITGVVAKNLLIKSDRFCKLSLPVQSQRLVEIILWRRVHAVPS